jgi:hypothetical protein
VIEGARPRDSFSGTRGAGLGSGGKMNQIDSRSHPRSGSSGSLSRCKRCAATRVLFVQSDEGPHRGDLICLECGHDSGQVETPWSVAWAQRFRLGFGFHRGRAVGELAKTSAGRDYLRWVGLYVGGSPAMAAQIVLRNQAGEVV